MNIFNLFSNKTKAITHVGKPKYKKPNGSIDWDKFNKDMNNACNNITIKSDKP